MKVFVTGATGFIGAHTALELLRAGHELRLLVRNPEAAQRYFLSHGYEVDDLVIGDMNDKAVVKEAIRGCDAVFHAAALVSLDYRKAREIYENNMQGIDSVIGSAHESGVKNIVYVSSLSALFQEGVGEINHLSSLGNPKDPYSKSKRDCDEYVRSMQAQGVPVQITYPSGVFGPDDPKLSESNHALITFLKMIPITSTGLQAVDVRDVAYIHRYLLEHPRKDQLEQARYIIAGHYYSWRDFHQLMKRVTGRRIIAPVMPGALFRALGSLIDLLRKLIPVDTPISAESMSIITRWTTASSDKTLQETGTRFQCGEKTFADTIRWLVEAGYVDRKSAGKACVDSLS